MLLELISRKLHYTYSFVIRRITWTNCLGTVVLENLISVTKKNVFRISSANISDQSVGHFWRKVGALLCSLKASSHRLGGGRNFPNSVNGVRASMGACVNDLLANLVCLHVYLCEQSISGDNFGWQAHAAPSSCHGRQQRVVFRKTQTTRIWRCFHEH